MKLLIRIGGRIMAEDKLFSGESKNIEYKVTVPEKSEKYKITPWGKIRKCKKCGTSLVTKRCG